MLKVPRQQDSKGGTNLSRPDYEEPQTVTAAKRNLIASLDKIHVGSIQDWDWHATILHLLGLHHKVLTYERYGLGERFAHQFETRVVDEIVT